MAFLVVILYSSRQRVELKKRINFQTKNDPSSYFFMFSFVSSLFSSHSLEIKWRKKLDFSLPVIVGSFSLLTNKTPTSNLKALIRRVSLALKKLHHIKLKPKPYGWIWFWMSNRATTRLTFPNKYFVVAYQSLSIVESNE